MSWNVIGLPVRYDINSRVDYCNQLFVRLSNIWKLFFPDQPYLFSQLLIRHFIRAILQKWVPYSQRYLVLGLVRLALWLVSGIAVNKYRCE